MKLQVLAEQRSDNVIKIRVPHWAMGEFWNEPPEGDMEFWASKNEFKGRAGNIIEFYYGTKRIATAKVARIESPGSSSCSHTGRFANKWKVFWHNDSFKDLR